MNRTEEHTIYLYDMSAIINSGTKSNTGGDKQKRFYNFNTFPTGGLYSFNSWLISDYKEAKDGDMFIACFDGTFNKLQRKLWYPDYKGNRMIKGIDDVTETSKTRDELIEELDEESYVKFVERKAVSMQLAFLRMILPEMGVNVLWREDLEADDWVYNICFATGEGIKEEQDDGSVVLHKYTIILRADDSDLDDCICYNPDIIKRSVQGRGYLKMYPGQNYKKIYHGETIDHIPNLYSIVDKVILDKVRNAIADKKEDSSILLDKEKLMAYGMSEVEAEAVILNAKLVSPIFLDIDELPDFNTEVLNREVLINYLSVFHFKYALERRLHEEIVTNQQVLDWQNIAMQSIPRYVSKYYQSKEYHADVTKVDIDPQNKFILAAKHLGLL